MFSSYVSDTAFGFIAARWLVLRTTAAGACIQSCAQLSAAGVTGHVGARLVVVVHDITGISEYPVDHEMGSRRRLNFAFPKVIRRMLHHRRRQWYGTGCTLRGKEFQGMLPDTDYSSCRGRL